MVILNPGRNKKTHKLELFIVRTLVLMYFAFAHFAMCVFFFSGLKIQWVNHRAWPYKKMLADFLGDFDDEY